MSRRLSKGSNVSLMDFESDDELADKAEFTGGGSNGLHTGGKRRSSLGGSKNKLNPTEQARIADMYKTVIKLAAENKITAKNSWNLELIDHMGSLIKEDGSDRGNRGGVNFQKASCTLDASVKIYSHRVDDTWSSSFRILENLSRGSNNQLGDDDEGEGGKNPARVGSKSMSNRLNLTATIEKNIASLNGEALDCNHSADPMFHKMSQAFDEGGAKGMLMANLRVVPNSSSLVFTSEGSVEEPSRAVNTAAPIDVTDLILHSGFTPQSISNLFVSTALETYRDIIGVEASSKGCLDTSALAASRDATELDRARSYVEHASSPGTHPLDNNSSGGGDNTNEYQFDDEDNDVCDMFDDDDFGGFEAVNTRRSSIIASPSRVLANSTGSTPGKGGGVYDPLYAAMGDDTGYDENEDEAINNQDVELEGSTNTATIMIPSAAAAGNEYSYFDANSLQSMGCNWAGARHWKLGLRSAIAKTSDSTSSSAQKGTTAAGGEVHEGGDVTVADGAAVSQAKRAPKVATKGAAKLPLRIAFSAGPDGAVDVAAMLPPKGKRGGDATCQTAGSVDKAMAAAREGALLLPPDAQFTAKDLCRLFLRPRLIVPPPDLKEHLQPALMRYNADSLQKVEGSLQASSVSSSLYGEKDFVWGSFATDILAFNANQNDPLFKKNGDIDQDDMDYNRDDNCLYEGFGEDDDDNGCCDDGDHNTSTFEHSNEHNTLDGVTGQMKGLSINNKNLIQAKRVVEKLEIGYATVAKRVNVKKLKHDLWSHLEDSLTGQCPSTENSSISDNISAGDTTNNITIDAENAKPIEGIKIEKGTANSINQGTVELSFQDVINDISHEQGQKDNLEISAVDSMSDLKITKPV